MINHKEGMDNTVVTEDSTLEKNTLKLPTQGHRIISLLIVPVLALSILFLPITLYSGESYFFINIVIIGVIFYLIVLHGKTDKPNLFSFLLLFFSVIVYIFLLAGLMGYGF